MISQDIITLSSLILAGVGTAGTIIASVFAYRLSRGERSAAYRSQLFGLHLGIARDLLPAVVKLQNQIIEASPPLRDAAKPDAMSSYRAAVQKQLLEFTTNQSAHYLLLPTEAGDLLAAHIVALREFPRDVEKADTREARRALKDRIEASFFDALDGVRDALGVDDLSRKSVRVFEEL